ncbi:hypothetical protein OnM2_055023 [Erysiphe neolycopersici]|uniref:Uncharacterized protein n=1 Tax=Erysiphe neolycopersici TaxID=212602 RepID=A0A420HR44_9PEZI|nr:hypothetical protein OnM2_055023 [Erysiphe neolycopersici]
MVSRKSSSTAYSDPSDKWMAKLCIEPPMDSQTCALAVFCPCILIGKVRWRIKQKELNLDPLQSAWHRTYSCNSSCCTSTFCLCPWYVNKFYSNIRSLYAIGDKINSTFKNYICCTCSLLQLDREIRAREGETRLRTNQRYNIDPVLTQPEISLPMKYISHFEAKPRSNYESPPIGAGTTKIRKVFNPTKRFTTEKALERRLFILRNVYSHGGLAVEKPLGMELEIKNHSHSERSDQKLLAPLHWKIKLTECGGDSSNNDFSVIPSSEYPSMLLTDKDGKLKRYLSPQSTLTDSTGIGNSNENLPYSRGISFSNFSNPNYLESSDICNSVEDQGDCFGLNPLEDEDSLDPVNKFDANFGIAQNKSNGRDSDLDKTNLGKLIEVNHSVDRIDTSAVANLDVKVENFRNVGLPIFFSELINSCPSQIYSAQKIVNNETQMNKPNLAEYKEKPEKIKLISCRTISSATVVDIPKSRSKRDSRDKVFATLSSGAENLSLNSRSVTKRPKWHSSTFVAPDQTGYSTEGRASNSIEGSNQQFPPLDTGKFTGINHIKPSRSEDVLRQELGNFSTSVSRHSQKIGPELSDSQEMRLNHISKLPICINREVRRNQPFNRPRLSPILSNENIYRQREKETGFLRYLDLAGKSKQKKDDHDRYRSSNSLHPEISTNRDGANTLSTSLGTKYVKSISRTEVGLENENAETKFSSEIKENTKANDEDTVTVGQAAQKALRLILVRTPSGVND